MKVRSPFVAIIGAGQVGATAAQRILEKGVSDVVLFDVVPGLPQGKALDLMEAAPLEGHDRRMFGTNDYQDIRGAEIVVITAGLPRKPGMSREDLLALNELRNALAHSFFPENRRVKPGWKGAHIFSGAGFDQFWDDMGEASDFFVERMRRANRRKGSEIAG